MGVVAVNRNEERERAKERHREIGNRVRTARKELGIRQTELADLLHVTERTMQAIEKGEVDPWRHVEALAPILNKTPGWIWNGKDDVTIKLEPEIRRMDRRLKGVEDSLEEILGLLRNGSKP